MNSASDIRAAEAVTRRALLRASAAMGAATLAPRLAHAAAAAPDVMVIAGDDIGTFDPTKTNSLKDLTIINCITGRLVRGSATHRGQVDPHLALSVEAVQPDRWRVVLRQGVKFHNGVPFTAETAKWSLNHYAQTAILKTVLNPLDHVDIVDDHTLDIVTKFPTGLMPLILAVVAEQLEPGWMTSSQYSPAALVGTGPARLVEWTKGQRVVLQVDPDHWSGPIVVDHLTTRPIGEAATRANAALAGEGDIIRNILGQDVPRFKDRKGMSIKKVGSNRCAHIRLRMDQPPFNNQLVRQAVNYAVDIPAIVTNVLQGYGIPLSGQMQGPFARYWQEDVKPYPYDPDKARALLKQAGFPNGFSTRLGTVRGRDQNDFEFSAAIAGQLSDVGIDADLVVNESGAYQAKYAGMEPAEPMFYWSSGNMIQDAENAFRDISYKRGGLELNTPAFADIIHRMERAVQDSERNAVAREGILYMRDTAPLLFGYQLVQAYAVSDRLAWEPRADEYVYLEEIRFA